MSLTHLSLMEFHTVINWNSLFLSLGILGGIFKFYSNFNRTFCMQTVETLLRCLTLRHLICVNINCLRPTKKNTRFICVK